VLPDPLPVEPEPLPVLPVPLPDPEVLPDPDVLPVPEVLPEPLVLPVPEVDVLEVPDVESVPSLLLPPPHPAIHSAAVNTDTSALDCCTFFMVISLQLNPASMDRWIGPGDSRGSWGCPEVIHGPLTSLSE
jgi:hypothetical protein